MPPGEASQAQKVHICSDRLTALGVGGGLGAQPNRVTPG